MVTVDLSRTVSEIMAISVKNHNIFSPLVFNAPLRKFPSEFCNGRSAQIARVIPVPEGGKKLTTCYVHSFRCNTRVWRTDRRTDRWICHNNIALSRGGSSRKFLGAGPWKVSIVERQKVQLCNYATIMSVQCHHCLLIELKPCNVITCIGGKTGGCTPPRPQPRTAPGAVCGDAR